MFKIEKMLKLGWTIDEMKYDHNQKWWYLGATHDSGEASIRANGNESLTAAVNDLYDQAIAETPAWYRDQLKKFGMA